jgi:hypothetical protein
VTMMGKPQQKERRFHYRHLKGGLVKKNMCLQVFGLQHKQGDMYQRDNVKYELTTRTFQGVF